MVRIYVERPLGNAEHTAFRARRANIDIDRIKTNIWEGNLASNLKPKFDQEQALSFTYVMQNKYEHVCPDWYLNRRMGGSGGRNFTRHSTNNPSFPACASAKCLVHSRKLDVHRKEV